MPFRRPAGLVALLATAAGSLTLLTAPVAAASSTGLVVSQVYGGGGNAGAPLTNDYVELFNRGGTAVSTEGLSVQYASATGTGSFAATALPTASVPPGGYFLVQLAGASGAALPGRDATGSTNLSGTAGKVALASGPESLGCNGGSTPCTPAQAARIVDLVGYGSANWFEGTAPAPAASTSTAVLRGAGGCTDTDRNAADFTAEAPAPRSSSTTAAPCGTATPPPDPEPEPGPSHGTVVPVSAVQGIGAASPLAGQRVTVDAVVTSLRTTNDAVSGFSVQEQDAETDSDPATSEGLLVQCATACPPGLAAGDVVRATGTVGEAFGSTRLDAGGDGGLVTVQATGAARPTPAVLTLPAAEPLTSSSLYESLEGMLATVSTPLFVTESFNLARFGDVVLAPSRAYQFTHTAAPSVEGYAAHLSELAKSRLTLLDDNDQQNDMTSGPDSDEPYPYPSGGLAADNRFRAGDRIERLTGVLEHSFGAWGLRPAPTETYAFTGTNPRAATPDDVGGRLKVASFNVLNYFSTIDTTSSSSSGPCAPSGTQDCRGADSEPELERQRAKIVAALTAMDADVMGLIEIQNDDDVSLAHLVQGLNAATAPGTYDYLRTGPIGTDAIKLAFVFTPATVEPVGEHAVLTSAVDPRFEDTRSRPALAQTFREKATGEVLTVSVNHLKSKGSSCGAADPDRRDGAGNCDLTRTRAAQALAEWLATDPTASGDPDRLVIGDLNAYKREAPVTALREAGYTDLIESFGGDKAYGYLFDGQLGYLDHALASPTLVEQVTGAGEWHINADEPVLLDYNDSVRDAGEAAFERESAARELYAPGPYRSSDHDPVVVGLALNRAPVADAGGPYPARVGKTVTLDASRSADPDGDALTFAWDLDGDGAFDDASGVRTTFGGEGFPAGRYPVAVQVSDARHASVATAVVEVALPDKARAGRP